MAEVISTATFGERRSHLMSAVFSTPSPSLVDSQETLLISTVVAHFRSRTNPMTKVSEAEDCGWSSESLIES